MPDPTTPSSAAQLLSAGAHAARNHVATLRSAGVLIDDAEIAGELATATSALQLLLERAITAARVELGERPTQVQITAAELLRHAERRAAREGWGGSAPDADAEAIVLRVDVPGTWAERLVADLLHISTGPAGVHAASTDPAYVTIGCTIDAARWEQDGAYLVMLAEACACIVEQVDGRAVLRLPVA